MQNAWNESNRTFKETKNVPQIKKNVFTKFGNMEQNFINERIQIGQVFIPQSNIQKNSQSINSLNNKEQSINSLQCFQIRSNQRLQTFHTQRIQETSDRKTFDFSSQNKENFNFETNDKSVFNCQQIPTYKQPKQKTAHISCDKYASNVIQNNSQQQQAFQDQKQHKQHNLNRHVSMYIKSTPDENYTKFPIKGVPGKFIQIKTKSGNITQYGTSTQTSTQTNEQSVHQNENIAYKSHENEQKQIILLKNQLTDSHRDISNNRTSKNIVQLKNGEQFYLQQNINVHKIYPSKSDPNNNIKNFSNIQDENSCLSQKIMPPPPPYIIIDRNQNKCVQQNETKASISTPRMIHRDKRYELNQKLQVNLSSRMVIFI